MRATTAQLREQTGWRLILLARLYRRELDVALKHHGLSEANTVPLRYLAQHPHGVRQGALAAALYLEGPSLIRVLDQLIDLGYIERLDDPADRRAKVIVLTDAGTAIGRRLATDLDRLRRRLFEGIPAADLEVCIKAFDVMVSNIRPAGRGANDA